MTRIEDAVQDALTASAADLLTYLHRRIGDEAPDLLSDVMLTAWRRAADLPLDPEQARMWLFGIARNVLANSTRGQRRRLRLAQRLRTHLPAQEQAPAADEGLEVRDAIDRLPADLAELIQLVHWDGFTLHQAAQLQGILASTARSRYATARTRLRSTLADTTTARS